MDILHDSHVDDNGHLDGDDGGDDHDGDDDDLAGGAVT